MQYVTCWVEATSNCGNVKPIVLAIVGLSLSITFVMGIVCIFRHDWIDRSDTSCTVFCL